MFKQKSTGRQLSDTQKKTHNLGYLLVYGDSTFSIYLLSKCLLVICHCEQNYAAKFVIYMYFYCIKEVFYSIESARFMSHRDECCLLLK